MISVDIKIIAFTIGPIIFSKIQIVNSYNVIVAGNVSARAIGRLEYDENTVCGSCNASYRS